MCFILFPDFSELSSTPQRQSTEWQLLIVLDFVTKPCHQDSSTSRSARCRTPPTAGSAGGPVLQAAALPSQTRRPSFGLSSTSSRVTCMCLAAFCRSWVVSPVLNNSISRKKSYPRKVTFGRAAEKTCSSISFSDFFFLSQPYKANNSQSRSSTDIVLESTSIKVMMNKGLTSMAGSYYICKKLRLREILVHRAVSDDDADWIGTNSGFTVKDVSSISNFFKIKKINQYHHCEGTTEECFGAFPNTFHEKCLVLWRTPSECQNLLLTHQHTMLLSQSTSQTSGKKPTKILQRKLIFWGRRKERMSKRTVL